MRRQKGFRSFGRIITLTRHQQRVTVRFLTISHCTFLINACSNLRYTHCAFTHTHSTEKGKAKFDYKHNVITNMIIPGVLTQGKPPVTNGYNCVDQDSFILFSDCFGRDSWIYSIIRTSPSESKNNKRRKHYIQYKTMHF